MYYSAKGVYSFFNTITGDILWPIKECLNKEVWAFMFKEDEVADWGFIDSKPQRGIIKNDHFYRYKSNSNELEERAVKLRDRYFASTYEEAVQGYNLLIKSQINKLENEIVKLNEMLIQE